MRFFPHYQWKRGDKHNIVLHSLLIKHTHFSHAGQQQNINVTLYEIQILNGPYKLPLPPLPLASDGCSHLRYWLTGSETFHLLPRPLRFFGGSYWLGISSDALIKYFQKCTAGILVVAGKGKVPESDRLGNYLIKHLWKWLLYLLNLKQCWRASWISTASQSRQRESHC